MRVLALIENDMYVRNFVTSGAFDEVARREGFAYGISSFIQKLRDAIPPERLAGTFDRQEKNRMLVWNFNKLSMYALRNKSATFRIKAEVETFGPYNNQESVAFFSQGRDIIPLLNVYARYGFNDELIVSENVLERVRQVMFEQFHNNESLERLLTHYKPNLVLYPITGVESTGTELVKLSQKYRFKTMFLINGWDNLSSKGVFPAQPDYLGAWGPQCMVDAIQIQGMPHHRIFLMGCSRYEDYFKPGNADEKIFPHKYILFAGATTPNDEITPLKMFDEALDEMGVSDVKVVYRPHPWRDKRLCYDLFEADQYKHVILDPQVADDYYQNKKDGVESPSVQNFPKLKYYPSLVNHALFMTSPMSSMLLEAALFNVPALVLAHDDGVHPIPGHKQAQYRHFEGCGEIPGWFHARTLDQIKPLFKKMVERCRDEAPGRRSFAPALKSSMAKYLFMDERSYAQRLNDAVDVIEGVIQQERGL